MNVGVCAAWGSRYRSERDEWTGFGGRAVGRWRLAVGKDYIASKVVNLLGRRPARRRWTCLALLHSALGNCVHAYRNVQSGGQRSKKSRESSRATH